MRPSWSENLSDCNLEDVVRRQDENTAWYKELRLKINQLMDSKLANHIGSEEYKVNRKLANEEAEECKRRRRMLVEDQKLDAVVKLPSGVFKPYAGVSTAILAFTKTNSGGTDYVWFYDVEADGLSLDDKRTPLLSDTKLGPTPWTPLSDAEHDKNNLPDVLARWTQRNGSERKRPHTAQSFCVAKVDIAAQGYDLSLNRYKGVVHEEIEHRTPKEILADLVKLEDEIRRMMNDVQEMLK
jgi:type I restriction enzyme M protein